MDPCKRHQWVHAHREEDGRLCKFSGFSHDSCGDSAQMGQRCTVVLDKCLRCGRVIRHGSEGRRPHPVQARRGSAMALTEARERTRAEIEQGAA